MAVELCKVSLWINASVQDAPFRVRIYEPSGKVREEHQYVSTLAEEKPRMAWKRYAEYRTLDEYRRGEAWGESVEPYRTKRLVVEAYDDLDGRCT